MIDINNCIQIGFLVEDLEDSISKWETFLGKKPDIVGETDGPEKSKCKYSGDICYGRIRQAIYIIGNTQIELIQPIGEERSFWRDCLKEKGPHLHHLAFKSSDIHKDIDRLESKNIPLVQYGEWNEGKGKYAYFDMRDTLNTVIELLDF